MSAYDLLTWRDEADAAKRVAELEAERLDAVRARRYAPHGQVRQRQARLESATLEALRAELELAEIQRMARLQR